MSTITDYQAAHGAVVQKKPLDLVAGGQQARVEEDGRVVVYFASRAVEDIEALRDWLTALLVEPA